MLKWRPVGLIIPQFSSGEVPCSLPHPPPPPSKHFGTQALDYRAVQILNSLSFILRFNTDAKATDDQCAHNPYMAYYMSQMKAYQNALKSAMDHQNAHINQVPHRGQPTRHRKTDKHKGLSRFPTKQCIWGKNNLGLNKQLECY